MPRTADYTIQGFLYQFNKTALEILNAQDDDIVTVEGIDEDIEVTSPASLTAIQCKYHEAKTSFAPSTIYKPLLQMLKHFSDNHTTNVCYVLFAHFPGVGTPPPTVDKSILEASLASEDKELIKKYISVLPENIDLDGFMKRFTMEFGPSYNEITLAVGKKLEENGFISGEIDTITYPNAIHLIALLSTKHDPSARKITKKEFIFTLKAIHTTAISRWTLALKSRGKVLQARRKQLKVHLNQNSRLRYFVIDPNCIEDYDSEIVLFISDYINKYHFKPSHISTPIVCLCANWDHVQDIQRRLYSKEVIAEDGHIGGEFKESRFFREPMTHKKSGSKIQNEFDIRLLSWETHGRVLNNKKCDDLFIIGNPNCDSLDTTDVNVEQLSGATMKEIKYIIGISDVYE